jgi:beta-N-acetylhexosaminidase
MTRTRKRKLSHLITSLCIVSALIFAPLQAVGSGQWAVGSDLSFLPTAHRPLLTAQYPRHPSKDALKWADSELKKMSLDEKIGQLISIGINASFLNQESDAYKSIRHQVEDNHVGGIILFGSPVYESVVLVNRMQGYARRPLLISADLERGAGMRFFDTTDFGWVMAVGATGNPDYARRMGAITGRESRALGVQQILAPVADVNNNAANPVINVRSYGEDPEDVGRYVAAFIKGAQEEGVIATAKHFPGHGNTAIDSHRGLPSLNFSLADLSKTEFVPFRASVEAGVGSVMVGHIALPQIDPTPVTPLPRPQRTRPTDTTEAEEINQGGTMPATLSPKIGSILRHDLGFDGLIVTDALSMSGLTVYFTQEEAGVRALLAGADMLLKPADVEACMRGLRKAVKDGRVTETRIDESVRRILAAKYDLGLVKQRITPIDEIDRVVASRDALKLAREIAEHAITLVRNDAQLLPLNNLRPDARIFNLVITNGDDRNFIANPFISQMARSGRRVETIALDDRSSEAEVQKALERAQGADLVLASLYGRVRTGQANSIGLPDAGMRALNTLLSRNAPVIGISFGNPYLLLGFPQMKTYIVAYGDMPALQQAAARALLGEIDITGKLPISLPSLYARGTGIQMKAFKKQTAELNNK